MRRNLLFSPDSAEGGIDPTSVSTTNLADGTSVKTATAPVVPSKSKKSDKDYELMIAELSVKLTETANERDNLQKGFDLLKTNTKSKPFVDEVCEVLGLD